MKIATILIPNATGPTNPGDQAILHNLLHLIGQSIPKSRYIIHSSDPHLYKTDPNIAYKPTLYMWAGFQNRATIIRIIRLFRLLISYTSTKLGFSIIISRELRNLLKDYKNADILMFAGGGYLRTQKGLTQTLNLLMILSMFQFAKIYGKKKIVAPISFGPFAYKWQERLSAHALRSFDLVSLREEYSFSRLKEYQLKNILLTTDLALLGEFLSREKDGKKELIIGFTLRKWLSEREQKKMEEGVFEALRKFCKENNAIVQPIAQLDNNKYGDCDKSIAERLAEKLKKAHIRVLPVKVVKKYPEDIAIYGKIDMLLGMRMHSLIFAAIHKTPFAALSYEHKTDGFLKMLGLSDYCIASEKVDNKNVSELLRKAYLNKNKIISVIDDSLTSVRKTEKEKWKKIFAKLH